MANELKPASTFVAARVPIVDDNKMATWNFLKILQDWDTKLRNGLNSIGQITQSIPASTTVGNRPEGIGTTLQNLDSDGVLLGPGADFSRAYVNKDTDHITDGTGSPMAGGKVAFAALVASAPVAGKTLEFDGAHWLPVAIAVSEPVATSEWINSYDAATGAFTKSRPVFADIAGQITTAQLPPDGITATVTTAKLTTLGANGSMDFVNGILVSQVQAT